MHHSIPNKDTEQKLLIWYFPLNNLNRNVLLLKQCSDHIIQKKYDNHWGWSIIDKKCALRTYMLWKSKNYKYDVKCDDQQQYKAILELAMVSTTGGIIYNSTIAANTSENAKNPIARNSLNQFWELFNAKQITFVHWLGDTKIEHQAIITGNAVCFSIPTRRDHAKISTKFKKKVCMTWYYTIHSLCSYQYQITARRCMLMVKL